MTKACNLVLVVIFCALVIPQPAFPQKTLPASRESNASAHEKVSLELQNEADEKTDAQWLAVVVRPRSIGAFLAWCERHNFKVVGLAGQLVRIRVRKGDLPLLSSHETVRQLDLDRSVYFPEGIAEAGYHALSPTLQLAYDGAEAVIAIGDDGQLRHEDFRGRVTAFFDNDFGEHGEMVAGIAAGGGHLDPRARGIAPQARLHLYDARQLAAPLIIR